MDIANIIKNAVVSANICPADDIAINGVVDADWDGSPRIMISERQTETEDNSQDCPLSLMTSAYIAVLASNRNTVINILKQATNAAFAELQTRAYNTKQSGIYAVEYGQYEVRNIADRTEFESIRTFNVLHKPTIGD